MAILLLISIWLGDAYAAEAVPPAELVKDGATVWRIALPPAAGVVERFAGVELTRYLEQISGARLGTARQGDDGHVIHLGLREHLVAAGQDLPEAKPGYDGYSICIAPRSIAIAGDHPRGVLYGVYDLLERLGCRWYVPTLDPKDPEVVPRRSELSLPVGQWSESGRIELRIYNGSALFFEIIPERLLPQIDWAAKNRYNGVSWQAHHEPGRVGLEMEQMQACGALAAMQERGLILHGPGHCFPYFLPTEKYFEEHPEWFGLHDGKRRPHGGSWPIMNYCWSNPQANAELIRNVEAFVQRWPQLRILYMTGIDGGQVCRCADCQSRGGPNLIVDLYNRLSDRLAEVAPGVVLESVMGYGPLEQPPDRAVPNGKWQAIYAHWGRNHRQAYGDADYAQRENMETWSAHFPRYQICAYYAAASHQPFHGPPFLHALAGDTEYLIQHRVTGTLPLQYPHGFWWNFSFNLAMGGLYPYYHPERHPRAALRDYAMTTFGPKAGPVLAEYLETLGDNQHIEVSYRASRGEATEDDVRWLGRMRKMIDRAAELAADEPVYAYRVGKLAAGMDVLLHLAPGRSRIIAAEQALADYHEGRVERSVVEQCIAEGRAYLAALRAHAAQVSAADNGVLSAEWLDGWTINRTMGHPLDEVEKKLADKDAP